MKQSAPAAARNREPIAQVLRDELPAGGTVLEIASGTGEHACFFAELFPMLEWQPTDPDPGALASIAAWGEEAGLVNLRAPLMLDAAAHDWPVAEAGAVLCINMIHISPWASTEGLFAGSARLLGQGAPLLLYGPYLEDGVETVPSNLAFDAWLKEKNERFGIRRIEDVDAVAARHGLARTARREMPANNRMLTYRRT